jgi:hypothetical protein
MQNEIELCFVQTYLLNVSMICWISLCGLLIVKDYNFAILKLDYKQYLVEAVDI